VPSSEEVVLVACNFTPIPRPGYRIGVPQLGYYRELLNSDAAVYGGSGLGNLGGVVAEAVPWHGQPASISVLLPPLSVLYWKRAIAP
jgi:1,4-alpha-glucan branching enzyme